MKNYNNILKNKTQINFCNVNLLKFPNKKKKNKQSKSSSFYTNSNISNEKETKNETTIFDEKDKTIQKLNLKINELETRIKKLESIIPYNQTIKRNKKIESNKNLSKLLTEPTPLKKKKRYFSQNQSPNKSNISNNNSKIKNNNIKDKISFKNVHNLINNLKLFTKNSKGRNISLSKMISRTNSIENIIHNYSYKSKNNSIRNIGRNYKKKNTNYNTSSNLSANTSSNISTFNEFIPKIPKKNIINQKIQFLNYKNDLNNIKNRTNYLLEVFSGKKFK